MTKIKGYKAFNNDWTCRGFQYEVGKTFTTNEPIALRKSGFHFALTLRDVFNCYDYDPRTRVAEVEVFGDVTISGNIGVANNITILKEIEYSEIKYLTNAGMDNLGLGNEGNLNTGWDNIGDRNTGWSNEGSHNTGKENIGNRNAGHGNRGSSNTGSENIGDLNVGSYNFGYYNVGNYNCGYKNTGDRNIGCGNTGGNNIGDNNTGSFNLGNNHCGFFCTEEQPIYMFNKPTNLTFKEITDLPAMKYAQNYFSSNPVSIKSLQNGAPSSMREIAKQENQRIWDNFLDRQIKYMIYDLPNFDANIFEQITGIKVGN